MIVTKENIGDIICRYDTGERFQVTDISRDGLSILREDGTSGYIPVLSHIENREVVHDENSIASFYANAKLAQSLSAAEQAAQRRLTSKQPNNLAAEEASRVFQIVQTQRQAFLDRLRAECRARQAEHAHSFDDKLNSAKDRSANQHQEQPIQSNDLSR